jgi:hypothetical protein
MGELAKGGAVASRPGTRVDGYSHKKEGALGQLRNIMEKVADLNEAVTKAEDEPEEAGLRALGQKLSKVKGDLLSLGRALMLSQDASLAAGAHELVRKAEEAIRAGQQKVRAALRGIGATSDISETGSVDLLGRRDIPTANQGIQPAASLASRRSLAAFEPGSEVTDLIQCLSGMQANDSRWPVFTGKYIEYPRFRKEWWAYWRTYHGHVRDKMVIRALKEKCLMGNVKNMIKDIEDLQEVWDTLDTCFDWPEK